MEPLIGSKPSNDPFKDLHRIAVAKNLCRELLYFFKGSTGPSSSTTNMGTSNIQNNKTLGQCQPVRCQIGCWYLMVVHSQSAQARYFSANTTFSAGSSP